MAGSEMIEYAAGSRVQSMAAQDRPPLVAQLSELRQIISDAHKHLDVLAGPAPTDESPSRPQGAVSGAPLYHRINAAQDMVQECRSGVLALVNRLNRLNDEANALG